MAPVFLFLNSFKLNLEERYLALDLNAHRVTKNDFWETPLFLTEAPVPLYKRIT